MIKKQIPNIITLFNLFFGCFGAIMAMQNHLVAAAVCVGLGIFFDFFDGLAARSLNVQSEVGLQLDSLADMVTSGLVPGLVMFKLMGRAINFENDIPKEWGQDAFFDFNFSWFALLGLLIALASAYRLANFNVDTEQSTSFKGLPTPANAIFILSLPLVIIYQPEAWILDLLLNQWVLLAITLLSCFILNAPIRLFAFKFKNFSLKENWFRWIFVAFVILALFFLNLLALPLIILTYVLFSLMLDDEAKR